MKTKFKRFFAFMSKLKKIDLKIRRWPQINLNRNLNKKTKWFPSFYRKINQVRRKTVLLELIDFILP